MKNKKGFTLVELLAVIAILAILVIIALPNVINMYNKAQKETFLTEAKKVHSEAEKRFISNSISAKPTKVINSEDNTKLDMTGEKLQYCVILDNKGKVTSMKVSNGKWVVSLVDGKTVEDLTIDDLEEGNLNDYDCGGKKPSSFENDSWETIVEAVRNEKDGNYKVGDTKEIDLGSLGKHIVRIANKSTPSECSTEGFSQTACGFVLEFADVILRRPMNDTKTNVGGWPASSMRTFVNTDIYNSLPVTLRNAVIDTMVVSGHGVTEGEENFTSVDKLYLLSVKELWTANEPYLGDRYFVEYMDTARDMTRQLDYYENLAVSATDDSKSKLKKNLNYNHDDIWWLRTAADSFDNRFAYITNLGNLLSYIADWNIGVAPAFRIG